MKKLGFWGFVGRWEGFCFSVVDIFCGFGEYSVYNCMVVFCGVNGIYLFVFGTIKRTFKPSVILDIFSTFRWSAVALVLALGLVVLLLIP